MDLSRLHNIFFLGIGGIGMSALARHFKSQGINVSGYDRTPTTLTAALIAEGIRIWFDDNEAIIPENTDLVVFTPAVPKDSALYKAFGVLNTPMMKRAELLGLISAKTPTIAVAGTHGKTTISAMVTHILKTAGIRVTAFLGGISANYNTNYIESEQPEWIVVEADEFDRSFLHLSPKVALISSMDADHLDIYGSVDALLDSFRAFASRIKPNGTLVIKKGLESKIPSQSHVITYHSSMPAHVFAKKLSMEGGSFYAILDGMIKTQKFRPGLQGAHNLENATGAAAIAHCLNIESTVIANALESFKGVRRRFEYLYSGPNLVYIDDYAHHPEEISACLGAARELFPEREITVIFQPHLFSRTRDLAEEFAKSLSLANRLILLDIYPARELPIEGVTSAWLLSKIKLENKQLAQKADIIGLLRKHAPQVLITMGAGDIDRITGDIVKFLKMKEL